MLFSRAYGPCCSYPESELPCFVGGTEAVAAFRDRFKRGLSDAKLEAHVKQVCQRGAWQAEIDRERDREMGKGRERETS